MQQSTTDADIYEKERETTDENISRKCISISTSKKYMYNNQIMREMFFL
jgi:hypothetical protein